MLFKPATTDLAFSSSAATPPSPALARIASRWLLKPSGS
jgi:hypothetical protein